MIANNKKVSFCLFTYNQEKYVQGALESVLNQDYSPLEIIISDDCSTDATCTIIEEVIERYKGDNQIIFNRNEKNLGVAAHFMKVCGLATGDYLILLACDDISSANHIQKAVGYMEKYKEASMIDFNGQIIDGQGNKRGTYQELDFKEKTYQLSDYLSLQQIKTFAPGRILRKELISDFEPMSKNCPTEDTVLVLRALMYGSLMRINEELVYYRRHDNNLSSSANLNKISQARIIAQYLRDALYLYNQNQIPEAQIGPLLDRINYEYHRREVIYKKEKTLGERLKLKLRKYLLLNS